MPINHRPLSDIGAEIRKDWGNRMSGMAKPYVDAKARLNSINDKYGSDTTVEVVSRFIGVAGTWHGATAKRIKTELKGILAAYERETLS